MYVINVIALFNRRIYTHIQIYDSNIVFSSLKCSRLMHGYIRQEAVCWCLKCHQIFLDFRIYCSALMQPSELITHFASRRHITSSWRDPSGGVKDLSKLPLPSTSADHRLFAPTKADEVFPAHFLSSFFFFFFCFSFKMPLFCFFHLFL